MNDSSNFNQPVYGEAPKRTMLQIMIDAITKPSLANYESLAREPGATLANGALWMFIALLVGALVGGLIGLPFQGSLPQQLGPLLQEALPETRELFRSIFESGAAGGMGLFGVICGAPVGAVIGLLFYIIGVGIQSWIARLFGGTGAFDKFFFVNAAFGAPIALTTGILQSIPIVNCVVFFISLYSIYLNFLTIRAVHQLDSGKAILVLLIPLIVGCVVGLCLGVGLAAILVPIISGATGGF